MASSTVSIVLQAAALHEGSDALFLRLPLFLYSLLGVAQQLSISISAMCDMQCCFNKCCQAMHVMPQAYNLRVLCRF